MLNASRAASSFADPLSSLPQQRHAGKLGDIFSSLAINLSIMLPCADMFSIYATPFLRGCAE